MADSSSASRSHPTSVTPSASPARRSSASTSRLPASRRARCSSSARSMAAISGSRAARRSRGPRRRRESTRRRCATPSRSAATSGRWARTAWPRCYARARATPRRSAASMFRSRCGRPPVTASSPWRALARERPRFSSSRSPLIAPVRSRASPRCRPSPPRSHGRPTVPSSPRSRCPHRRRIPRSFSAS